MAGLFLFASLTGLPPDAVADFLLAQAVGQLLTPGDPLGFDIIDHVIDHIRAKAPTDRHEWRERLEAGLDKVPISTV